MPYGILKCDTITFTDGGIDKSVSISGLVQNPTFSGNITVTGTVSGNTIQGQTVSGVTVTGTTSNFASGVFTTQISGATVTGNVGSFTTITGGTVTLTSGVFGAGTASSPSIAFTGDLNTGIYSPGADQVAVATNGTGRLFVDSTGKIGTGISPVYTNHIKQNTTYGFGLEASSNDSRFLIGNVSSTWRIAASYDTGGSYQDITVFTSDLERLRISSAGLVGVGTSSPSYTLDVTGTHRNSGIYFNENDTPQGTAGTITKHSVVGLTTRGIAGSVFDWSVYSAGGTALIANGTGTNNISFPGGNVVFTGGSVGIGTTSPRFLVSLGSTSATGSSTPDTIDLGGTFSSTAGANPKLRLYWDGSQSYGFGVSSGQLDYMVAGAAAHVWHINNSERARIDSSGRLLVGTSTAPTIFGTNPLLTVASNTGFASLGRYSSSTLFGADLSFVKSRNDSIALQTIVQNNDQIGGISFHGSDGTSFIPCARIEGYVDGTPGANDMPGRLVLSVTVDGASSPTERMRISNGGGSSFYADTNSLTAATAQAAGTTFRIFTGAHSATNTTSGTISFQVFSNGNVQNTNNSYGAISDFKLKENIVSATSQWSDIKALQIRKYNFKEGQTHTQIGLVAQEVELVSPGLVSESPDRDEDGNDLGTVTKSVNYSVLYMKAVKALQEAMERIETLEQRLNDAGIN